MEGRKRYPALTPSEVLLLNDLVNQNDIINNACHDTETSKKKDKAWREVEEKFNSSPVVSVKRDVDKLKKAWINLKQKAKEFNAKRKQDIRATGGGPSTITGDNVMEKILATVGPTIAPFSNTNDSDNQMHHDELPVPSRYFFPKKKKRESGETGEKPESIEMQLAKQKGVEHLKRMEVLEMEKLYWTLRVRSEFPDYPQTVTNSQEDLPGDGNELFLSVVEHSGTD